MLGKSELTYHVHLNQIEIVNYLVQLGSSYKRPMVSVQYPGKLQAWDLDSWEVNCIFTDNVVGLAEMK